MPATASAVQAGRVVEPDQLPLRFFAIVGGMHSAPPERALWRELLDLALGTAKTLTAPDGRSVSASAAWAVGAAVYFRANARGVVEGFSHDMLAADCRLDPRTARSALKVLAFLRIVAFKAGPRRQQRGPRPRALHMNLGGLDWPAVRRRAKREQTEQADLLVKNSGHHARQLDGNSGHHARQLDGNSGHHARQLDGNSGHHARQQRATSERATNLAVAAAGTPVGKEGPAPDHRTEQQQQETSTTTNTTTGPPTMTGDEERREQRESRFPLSETGPETKNEGTANAREEREPRRVEGLIAAIATRSRGLHRRFDEAACREALTTGRLTVDQLQARADELQDKLTAAGTERPAGSSGSARRRGHGRYDRPDLTDEEQRIYQASGGNPWAVRRYREDEADD